MELRFQSDWSLPVVAEADDVCLVRQFYKELVHKSHYSELETMTINLDRLDVSPLTAGGSINKTQPSIGIGPSNTSVERISQWPGH
eukprot:scaffold19525_cov68-Cyclotella_meneghiniana.AAC.1